jgi:hypothetical protein
MKYCRILDTVKCPISSAARHLAIHLIILRLGIFSEKTIGYFVFFSKRGRQNQTKQIPSNASSFLLVVTLTLRLHFSDLYCFAFNVIGILCIGVFLNNSYKL